VYFQNQNPPYQKYPAHVFSLSITVFLKALMWDKWDTYACAYHAILDPYTERIPISWNNQSFAIKSRFLHLTNFLKQAFIAADGPENSVPAIDA
jgi:hypothetical protein